MVFDLYYGVWRIKNAWIPSGALSHVPPACAVCLRSEPVAGDAWEEDSPRQRCLSSAPALSVVSPALFCAFSGGLEIMLEIRKMCYCDISGRYQQYSVKLHSVSFAFSFSEIMFLQDYF